MAFVAVYDACVLHPISLRDLLVRLAQTGLFRARWTDQIHDEWIRSVHARYPQIALAKLEEQRKQMDAAVPDALLRGHEQLIDCLELPDPDDRHVLAAAICAQAGVIVTSNLKDFPEQTLENFGMHAQHPDEFVHHLCDLSLPTVCQVVKAMRAARKNPPCTAEELLEKLQRAQMVATVASLRPMVALL